MYDCSAQKYARRELGGHLRVVELCKPKGRLAQLAMFLLRVRQPLHQAVLVDKLDATAAFARVEQGFFSRSFSSTYSAGIWFVGGFIRGSGTGVVIGVVHDVGYGGPP